MSRYYRIIFRVVFGLGIFILPFVWWPDAAVKFELPRVWFLHRWVELLAILTVVFWKQVPDLKFDKRVLGLVLVFFGVAIGSSFVGADTAKSFVGNYWRGDGLATLGHLVGLALLVGVWWDKQLEKITLLSIGLSVVVVGIGSLFWNGFTFGQPNFLAGWIVVAGAVAMERVNSKLGLLLMISVLVGIITSNSWATLLIFGGYLAIRYPKLRIAAIIGVIGLSIWWINKKENFSWLGPSGVVYEGRERIFRKVIGGIAQRPVLGWGYANVDYAFESNDWPFPVTHDVYLDKAHSEILEVTATMGVVGLGVYLGLVGIAILKLRKTHWFWPVIVLIIHSQTNIVASAEQVIFWMIVGIALKKAYNMKNKYRNS